MYFSVRGGKFVKKVDEDKVVYGTTGERTNKNGVKVMEDYIDSLDNVHITNVVLSVNDYGEFCQISLSSEKFGSCVLSVGVNSNYYKSFMNRLEGFNLSKPLDIKAYEMITEKNTTKTGLWFIQNGLKVASFYTKEDPKGLPQAKVLVVNKKNVYDFTDQLYFYEELLKKTFPSFKKYDNRSDKGVNKPLGVIEDRKSEAYVEHHAQYAQERVESKKAPKNVVVENSEDDDLPF